MACKKGTYHHDSYEHFFFFKYEITKTSCDFDISLNRMIGDADFVLQNKLHCSCENLKTDFFSYRHL